MEAIGFTIACKKFFGLKDDESLAQFAAELHALTIEDKKELAPLLSKELDTEVIVK